MFATICELITGDNTKGWFEGLQESDCGVYYDGMTDQSPYLFDVIKVNIDNIEVLQIYELSVNG